MKELAKINPEEVRKYYIDQHHSLLQTAKYFGRSQSGMEKFLKRNEIKKPAEEVALIRKQIIAKNYAKSGKKTPVNRLDWKMPGLEEIEEKYFSGMTQKQLAVFYRVSLDTIRSWLARYGIKKDQKDVEESRKASTRRHFGCDYAMQSAEVRKKARKLALKNMELIATRKQSRAGAEFLLLIQKKFPRPKIFLGIMSPSVILLLILLCTSMLA